MFISNEYIKCRLLCALLCVMVFSCGCLRDSGEIELDSRHYEENEKGTELSDKILSESESDSAKANTTTAESKSELETEKEKIPAFPLGIYVSGESDFRRVGTYKSRWPESDTDSLWTADTWTYPGVTNLISDIAYFGILPSNEETHRFVGYGSEYMENWKNSGLDGYKTGLEFTIVKKNSDNIRFTVKSAEDTFKYEEYFEVYLYDDVAHANDSWYSHITPDTTYDDTLITTFKITLRDGCYDVDYIEAAVFVYDNETEFDEEGFYIGAEKRKVIIKRDA